MNAKGAISATINLSQMILTQYLSDLDDADLLRRPSPGCNHLAWQLGHLISSEVGILSALVPGAAPELPAGFKEQHDKTHTTSDSPADFCTKAKYLELIEQVHTATKQALEAYDETQFDLPAPESFRGFMPTNGDVWVLIGTHPIMHAGQFVPVRRALGKPIVI